MESLHYKRYEANVSDHRPVSGGFAVRVKSIRMDERGVVKVKVESEWRDVHRRLLGDVKVFYEEQGLI